MMLDKEALPPFRTADCVAVAFVTGRYTPPGPRLGPRGFLGLYLSRVEERFSFWTFRADGYRLAYCVVSPKDANLEFALICGAVDFAVPFDQWRLYPLSSTERRIIRRRGLAREYDEVRRALCRVLYHARIRIYTSIEKVPAQLGLDPKHVLKPMFAFRPRSRGTIRRDKTERDEIDQSIFERP
jgi:hypothetical protein